MNNELIGWYLNKSTGERVDFLYMNYPRLKRIMKGYQDSLYILIKNEREYSKHTGNDIGVRIMTTVGISDPTQKQAMENMLILEAIQNFRLTDDCLAGINDTRAIKEAYFELTVMKREIDLLNTRIKALSQDDEMIVSAYINRGKSIYDLAEDLCIEPESVRKKLYRIKRKIKKDMMPFMLEYEEAFF